MTRLEGCIRFFESESGYRKAFLNPSVSAIFEETLKALKELQAIKQKEEAKK